MKTKTLVLAITAAMALPLVMVAGPTNDISASTSTAVPVNTVGPRIHVFTPLDPSLRPENNQINRYGNISSRPWTETVGWNPGMPTWRMDEDPDMRGSGLSLFWVGQEPEH